MFDLDKWREIYDVFRYNKLRSFLTVFGVFWGMFMLLIMLGAGKGLYLGTSKWFSDWASNSAFVWSNETTMPYKGFNPGRVIKLTNADTRGLRKNIAEIDKLAPRHQLNGKEQRNGTKITSVRIFGDYPDYASINLLQMTQGRFINERDIKERRKVVVLGTMAYEQLFKNDENPVGKNIQIDGITFKVVGLLKKPAGNDGEWQMRAVYIPFTTLQYTFNFGDEVGYFAFTIKPNAHGQEVADKVLKYIKEVHAVHPDDKAAFGTEILENEYNKVNGMFFWIEAVSWFVGGFTLLAGVIGISNIMLITIRERTKEIGIRRALGASPWAIINQILLEALTLTFLAGYFGLVVGIFLLEMVSKILQQNENKDSMFMNPGVDLGVALSALAILIAAGLLAGLIPAYKAMSIRPVEALRSE